MTDKLIIPAQEAETIDVLLSPNRHPIAFERKVRCMMTSGLTRPEAEAYVLVTPLQLEIFYDVGQGLFALESEAIESITVFNPYTGDEVPKEDEEGEAKTESYGKKKTKILVLPSYYEIHVLEVPESEAVKHFAKYRGMGGLCENGNVFDNLAALHVRLCKVNFDDSIVWDEGLRTEVEMLYGEGVEGGGDVCQFSNLTLPEL